METAEELALKRFKEALEEAWRQRQAAIDSDEKYEVANAAYLAAIDAASKEYRKVCPGIVQPSGVD